MKRLVVAAGLLAFAFTAAAADRKAEDLYPKSCALCHANAGTGAPKTGDAKAWEPRMAKGIDTLVANATNGFNAMPGKGMCFDCTPEEFKALILFMAAPK